MNRKVFWACPVDGFKAYNIEEQDKHIQETGHFIYDRQEEPGKHKPRDPSDLEYSEHSGYTPGVSSGDVEGDESDIKNKQRIEKEKGKLI